MVEAVAAVVAVVVVGDAAEVGILWKKKFSNVFSREKLTQKELSNFEKTSILE